ncbi:MULTISPECIES: hypothetical protein [unclassified Microcoleus]|uniref:hypothetical protein n=1 Tax=unclassified Microcoleus TaxID=2642155 RepID=UPI002FD55111
MSTKKPEPRQIIDESPKRHPYGAKVGIILDVGDELGFNGEACLLVDDKSIVRISPLQDESQFGRQQPQKLDVYVEGFATAAEAEQKGLKLSLALLWEAVSRKHPLRLDYHTPRPCMVYDRTQESGSGCMATASATVVMNSSRMVELVNQIFSANIDVDEKLLVSMELFASARLETTERTRFVGLVSSLEPLAQQEAYEISELKELVKSFVDQLNTTSIPDDIKSSLRGRINELKQESVSRAIRRLVKEHFPENLDAVSTVEEAYDIRSKILHDGAFDADLEQKSNEIEDIIRQIYSRILKLELYVRPNQ